MSEIARRDTSPEITDLAYGQPLRVFKGAMIDGRGTIHVPERRVMLSDIPVAATIRPYLHKAEIFDPNRFRNFDQNLVDQLDKTHTPDVLFTHEGKDAYARRNIYPFGKDAFDEHGKPVQFASLEIAMNFDFGDDTYKSPEFDDWLDAQIEGDVADQGPYQLRFDVDHANAFAAENLDRPDFTDFDRPKRQLIMLSIGGQVAVAPYDEQEYILNQSLGAFSYNKFGIIGGDKYYDILTPGSPDILGFAGGTLLVPCDPRLLETIELKIVSPADYPKELSL